MRRVRFWAVFHLNVKLAALLNIMIDNINKHAGGLQRRLLGLEVEFQDHKLRDKGETSAVGADEVFRL